MFSEVRTIADPSELSCDLEGQNFAGRWWWPDYAEANSQIPLISMDPSKTFSNCNRSSHIGLWPWHQDSCHLVQSPVILHGKEHSRLSLFFVSHSPKQHNPMQFPLANQFRVQSTT